MRMKIIIIAPLFLIFLAPFHAIADLRPTFFVEHIGGAALDLDEDDPIDSGQVNPNAHFGSGTGKSFRAAASGFYIGYSNLFSKSRSTHVEYRAYSAGISIRDKDYRSEFITAYYDIALGIGHSEIHLNGEREDHYLAEVQGSLGVVFANQISLGLGASARALGYPGETAAFITNPYITVGIWF